MSFPYIVQGSNVTVVIDNRPHTVSKSHVTYQKVVDAIKASDWDRVRDLIEPKKVVLSYGRGNVSIQGDQLFWKGQPMHNALATRMIAMLQEDFPIEPLVLFMENLMTNPSKRAVDELYGFLEKNNLPITPDGHFLAYKKVRTNYLDIHSGTMDNSVGRVVEMERNQVDDNKDRTCSVGLHFCSQEYLPSFGGSDSRVMILKINPRDVVSIPSDYNNAKGRACRYEVIGEVGNNQEEIQNAFAAPVQNEVKATDSAGPKLGGTPFYRGYTDGYANYDRRAFTTLREQKAYNEGFAKGSRDYHDGVPARYQFDTGIRVKRGGNWSTPI